MVPGSQPGYVNLCAYGETFFEKQHYFSAIFSAQNMAPQRRNRSYMEFALLFVPAMSSQDDGLSEFDPNTAEGNPMSSGFDSDIEVEECVFFIDAHSINLEIGQILMNLGSPAMFF